MIRWWKNLSALKHARQLVKGTRKLLRMHSDVVGAELKRDVRIAVEDLAVAVKHRRVEALDSLIGRLDDQLSRAFPRQSYASLRENVEVFLVAAIVAMAVRTFFIQPFKIPTGSMQPTLYGIFPPEPGLLPYDRNEQPALPVMLFGMAWSGKIYERQGYRSRGDHIFVDRFTYHFRKPKRGEVIVFDTSDIEKIPEQSRGKFYIKRLVGISGDRVEIHPPEVWINGRRAEGLPFDRMHSHEGGRTGYLLPRGFPLPEHFRTESDAYEVPERSLFVLGDNSASSLDGRFWGSVRETALVGRAVMVYWPFTRRFGPIH